MKVRFNSITKAVLVLTLLGVAIGLWVFYSQYSAADDGNEPLQEHLEMAETMAPLAAQAEISEAVCNTESPKSGGKYLLTSEDVDIKSSGKLYFSNEHLFPVWVRIFEYETLDEYGAIFLEPQKSSQFQLPINDYKVIVESGSRWCNFNQGFTDAAIVDVNEVILIRENEAASLRLLPFGQQASDVMVSFSHTANTKGSGASHIRGSGSLLLQRVVGGHYAVDGTVNNVPLQFLLDTGASRVSLPERFAKRAGITACKKSKSRTANGIVDTCIARVRELSIGQFTLRNVEVSYGKGLPEDTFLLGMNVISQFSMEQKDDVMKLTLP